MSLFCDNIEKLTYRNNIRMLVYLQNVMQKSYYTKNDIDGRLSQFDFTNYYTKSQINRLIQPLIDGVGGTSSQITEEQVQLIINQVMENVAQQVMTEQEIRDIVNSIEFTIPVIGEQDPTDEEIRRAVQQTLNDLNLAT